MRTSSLPAPLLHTPCRALQHGKTPPIHPNSTPQGSPQSPAFHRPHLRSQAPEDIMHLQIYSLRQRNWHVPNTLSYATPQQFQKHQHTFRYLTSGKIAANRLRWYPSTQAGTARNLPMPSRRQNARFIHVRPPSIIAVNVETSLEALRRDNNRHHPHAIPPLRPPKPLSRWRTTKIVSSWSFRGRRTCMSQEGVWAGGCDSPDELHLRPI